MRLIFVEACHTTVTHAYLNIRNQEACYRIYYSEMKYKIHIFLDCFVIELTMHDIFRFAF